MPEWVFLIAAVLSGGAAAWLIAGARSHRKIGEVGSSAASAERLLLEFREQAGRKEAELNRVREDLAAERLARAKAEAELNASLENLREQRSLLNAMKKDLSDTFNALSSSALKSSSEDFLRLASERMGKLMAETKGRLGEHSSAMDGLIKPLSETLRRYEEQIRSIEVKRGEDYAGLDEQIKLLASTNRELQKETGNLVSALKKPHIRGRWGEITLRNVVELVGMSRHCDFTEQVSVATEDGRLRPDMVVHMPGGHDIVVDAKVSMEALLDAASADTEEGRREALKRHASHVREQVKRLGSKPYWQQFEKSPELAVLFTGEAAMTAALEADPTLIEDSLSKRVLIATPTTLFALLTAVAYGWRQEQVTKNAEIIAALGRELYDRVTVWARHINEMGVALGRATETYNRAVGSLEARVLPSLRKFRELGTSASEDLQEPRQVEHTPRNLSLIE